MAELFLLGLQLTTLVSLIVGWNSDCRARRALEGRIAQLESRVREAGADRLRFEAALIRAATRRGNAEEDLARDLRDGWRPRA